MSETRFSIAARRATPFLVVLLAAPFLGPAPALADDVQYAPGVWHYRSVSCVDSTVRSVEPRLTSAGQKVTTQDFVQSGVVVDFNTMLGSDPANPRMRSSVTHYQDAAGNTIMMREHPGDRVQVCFVSRPAPTVYCNPDKDGRGRVFRVYDYRQHAQYAGMNSEHDCGGA